MLSIPQFTKTIFATILQNSCNPYNFCKIFVENTYLARLVNLEVNLAEFLQQYCNTFSFLAKILQELCFLNLARNAFFVRTLQNLARNKFFVYTLRSDNLCISPKSKHNQPLEVEFDELYTC